MDVRRQSVLWCENPLWHSRSTVTMPSQWQDQPSIARIAQSEVWNQRYGHESTRAREHGVICQEILHWRMTVLVALSFPQYRVMERSRPEI